MIEIYKKNLDFLFTDTNMITLAGNCILVKAIKARAISFFGNTLSWKP